MRGRKTPCIKILTGAVRRLRCGGIHLPNSHHRCLVSVLFCSQETTAHTREHEMNCLKIGILLACFDESEGCNFPSSSTSADLSMHSMHCAPRLGLPAPSQVRGGQTSICVFGQQYSGYWAAARCHCSVTSQTVAGSSARQWPPGAGCRCSTLAVSGRSATFPVGFPCLACRDTPRDIKIWPGDLKIWLVSP